MISKTSKTLFLQIIFCLGFLCLSVNGLSADDIDADDFSPLKSYNFLLRSKRVAEVAQTLTAKKEPTYVESYLLALILQNKKDSKSAAIRFANAGFKYKPLPANYTPAVLIPYMESGTRRSPLYAESVFELSRIYLQLYGAETASKMLALLPGDAKGALHEKVTEFRVEIISRLNSSMAIEIYKGILRDYQSPLLYLRLGGLYYLTGNYELSLENYLQVLEYPENDWTYIKTIKQVEFLLKKAPQLKDKLGTSYLIKMAEGYRLVKRYGESLALWSKIDPSKLDKNDLYLYLQNRCRLDINRLTFSSCLNLVHDNIARLEPPRQEKLYGDLGSRLFSSGQYALVVALVGENDFRQPSLIRLRALDKINNESNRAQLQKEASKYLLKFDNDSMYAEGVFFGACFEYLEQAQNDLALSCLQDLANATTGSSVGGRARYFMGRIYEKKGEHEKAQEFYKQVYLNSPEHFYAIPALREITPVESGEILIPANPSDDDRSGMSPEYLKTIQGWIVANFNRPEAMERYFTEKKKRPGFGVDRFWVEFEEKFHKTVKSLTPEEEKAALFAAMGFDRLAAEYLDFLKNPERKFIILLHAGIVTGDAWLKAANFQALLTMYRKQADIMTLSPFAASCLYPTPFKDIVVAASEKYQIEAARVYALMKQESGFHPGATSRSGARGLMQLMPATAKWLNKTLKIKNLDLYDPTQSIELGGFFYSWLNKVSDGKFENMAIAYNAGPTMLAIWRTKFFVGDQEMFLEKIPVDETYFYVQRTRNYYDRYKILFDNNYPNLPAVN